MRQSILTIFLVFCFVSFSFGQEIVTETAFLEQVLKEHPIARQADLKELMGAAKLLKARGGFDPKIGIDYKQKSFDGKNYYQVMDGEVKIPTWIGLDVKLAYNWNNGLFINTENSLPSNGLYSAGVELPVLQGMIFDKRRADLQKGKNYERMGVLERRQLLNTLLFEASTAYWEWYEANENLKIAEEGVRLAENTFNFVKATYRLGDKAAVDTLEALIQIQNRKIDRSNSLLELENARLWASSYLWIDLQPALILEVAGPEDFENDAEAVAIYLNEIETKLDSLVDSNPKIQLYRFKVDNLTIEKRLKKEYLKPQLNVGYNFINQPFDESVFDQFNIANYKWNVNFSMPLFLRKARGDFKLAKAELETADLTYSAAQFNQRIKIQSILNKIKNYEDQLALNSKNIIDNRNLVVAEQRKFDIGESSVFLVNYREISLLKVLGKQVDIEKKLKVSIAELALEIGGDSTF